ncbi:MAG: hypothetical protein VW057_10870 [Rhodospirillaceae bacterium]
MNLIGYRDALANSGIRMFCSKPYGLELMLILDAAEKDDDDNGVDDTFDAIMFNKPRRGAFSNFLKLLLISGHIQKIPSSTKACKSVLRLSPDVTMAV